MTDIEQKALALVNEVARELGWGETKEIFAAGYTRNEALCRAIEQRDAIQKEHDDFKQKVSDALMQAFPNTGLMPDCLVRLIIPEPKPDPLFDVLWDLGMAKDRAGIELMANRINETLNARGLEIREKNDG